MNKSQSRADKLRQAERLYFIDHNGITDTELANALGIDRKTAYLVRKQLGAALVSEGRYTLTPTVADIELAQAILSRAAIQ